MTGDHQAERPFFIPFSDICRQLWMLRRDLDDRNVIFVKCSIPSQKNGVRPITLPGQAHSRGLIDLPQILNRRTGANSGRISHLGGASATDARSYCIRNSLLYLREDVTTPLAFLPRLRYILPTSPPISASNSCCISSLQ